MYICIYRFIVIYDITRRARERARERETERESERQMQKEREIERERERARKPSHPFKKKKKKKKKTLTPGRQGCGCSHGRCLFEKLGFGRRSLEFLSPCRA